MAHSMHPHSTNTWEAILKMRAPIITMSPVRERLVSQYDCMLQTGASGDFFSALEEACHLLSFLNFAAARGNDLQHASWGKAHRLP